MQVITEYDDSELDEVLKITEKLDAHLTAAVVSNDVQFLGKACHLPSAIHHSIRHLFCSLRIDVNPHGSC